MSGWRNTLRTEWTNFGNLLSLIRSQSLNSRLQTVESRPIVNSPGSEDFPGGINISGQQQEQQTSANLGLLDKAIRFFILGILTIVFVPLYICYKLIVLVVFFLAAILNLIQSPYVRLDYVDASDVASNFIRNYDARLQKFNSRNGDIENRIDLKRPNFMKCSYVDAAQKVKSQYSWLLLYIASPELPDCFEFEQNVLSDETILNFINSNNIKIWGGDITFTEAFQVSNQLNVSKLPFLGLMCMTRQQTPTSSGVQQSSPRLSLVVKINGLKDPSYVYKKLKKGFRKYNPGVVAMNSERGVSTAGQHQSNTSVSTSSSSATFHTANDELSYKQWLEWRASKLPTNSGDSPARIAVKLPDGSRKQFSLPKTASVDDIYAYVECKIINQTDVLPNGTYTEPVGFNHQYTFSLSTAFPHKEVLPIHTPDQLEDISSIYPSGTLIIDYI